MESEKTRTEMSSKKSIWERYLVPITIVSSIVVSGVVGYSASQWGEKSFASDSGEVEEMKEEMTKARNQSLEVIEAEIPMIIDELDSYDQDIQLISENIDWLESSLQPMREATGKFGMLITGIQVVNTVAKVPFLDKVGANLDSAKAKLGDIDSILLEMESLSTIQNEMKASQEEIASLYEQYQTDKDINHLILIEQELNSNLVYQVEDLKNLSEDSYEILELSSSVLTTINLVKTSLDSAEGVGAAALDTIQFWKKEEETKIDLDEEEIEQDIEDSKEKIQDLPTKLEEQSRNTITSIHTIQNELQIVKITEMVIGE